MNFLIRNKNYLPIFFFFIMGLFISLKRGSNFSDGDSFDVILSFLNFIDYGLYSPSRGAYGHLVPEFIIGFFAYNFGTPISNLICFLFFFSSIFVLAKTFELQSKKIILFYVLALSNFLLLSENTNSIDYPIALFFFSLGIFFLKKNKIFITSFFFGLAIISRANFVIFIYPIIFIYFIYKDINRQNVFNFLSINFLTTLIGICFFIPTLNFYEFSIEFIKIPFLTESETPGWYGGPELSYKSLLPRFIYKIYLIIGIYSSFIFLFIFFFNFRKIFFFKNLNNAIYLYIVFSNLLLFLFMPVKTLLLNPFIIFSYLLLIETINKKIINLIIVLNILQWIVSYSIFDIKYKEQNLCFAKEAINAKFNLNFTSGSLINFVKEDDKQSLCYSKFMREYSDQFQKNLPLKLSKDTIR